MVRNIRSYLLAAVLLGAVVVALIGPSAVSVCAHGLDAATRERIARFDRGPAAIDVSKYPEAAQRAYALFARKCSRCHKLSRPINADFALPGEWARYIKRMMHKPGSGIGRRDAKRIYQFLVYDSSIRKQAMLDRKLSKLSPRERSDAEAKLMEVEQAYDRN